MSVRSLAEAVILQSLEDLWNPSYREESREFFEGSGFKMCAEIAGMDSMKQHKILYILGRQQKCRDKQITQSTRMT